MRVLTKVALHAGSGLTAESHGFLGHVSMRQRASLSASLLVTSAGMRTGLKRRGRSDFL